MADIYNEETNRNNTIKIFKTLNSLPLYVTEYINYRSMRLSKVTILNHVHKIDLFYDYLSLVLFEGQKPKTQISVIDIQNLELSDISGFMSYLSLGGFDQNGRKRKPNSNVSVTIYLSVLSTFFDWLVESDMITKNIIRNIKRPKGCSGKELCFLDNVEEQKMLDSISSLSSANMTKKQYYAAKRDKARNNAICILLISTGCRVSELVALDLEDVNFRKSTITLKRKNKKIDLQLSDLAKSSIKEYLSIREFKYKPKNPDEPALFLSAHGKRLGVRAIENMVANVYKRAGYAGSQKVTPRLLRNTYALQLLETSGNDTDLFKELMGNDSLISMAIYLKAREKAAKKGNSQPQ